MMSKVSSNGPAFLLRMRLARSASLSTLGTLLSADVDELDREHLERIGRLHDVVEVEAEDLAALGIGGAVGAGDTGDQAAPLRDRQVERLMAHDRRDGGGEILRRRGHLERSEEHTSELQSLMRTTYAVVCLKKK